MGNKAARVADPDSKLTRSSSSSSLEAPPKMKDHSYEEESSEIHTDPGVLRPWNRLEDEHNELQKNTVRETKEKCEILDAQKTHHENTLYEKNKELALKLKDKGIVQETLKKEFDLFWKQSVQKIIRDTPPIKDIDIMRDVREILSDIYESAPVDHWKESRDIFSVPSYSDYVIFKEITKSGALSPENETEIRSLITDVAQQTDKIIQFLNISKMGYNKGFIQLFTSYIKTRVNKHQEESVKYVFKNEFFMDLVVSICKRANKMITDQHRLFRDANDPVIYFEKKREEYYSIFQKYCHGAASAAIFGEIICQKLKEPIEQSVYKKTARDLTNEMRSNCESLNGNRTNLEKHILKTLAEEEDFDKYMNYIHNPRDHFMDFIRDEVSQYITDKFSVSVLPKMKENIELLQQKIMKAAHESTEHVQANRGDVGLWLKRFTQQLSDVLIFSEKDLSGVNHDDVDDFNLLEDVIRQELPVLMSKISSHFSDFLWKLDYKDRPHELLVDHLCRCCWVQCPFCGATCTNTIENHNGDHSVPFHRINGLNGFYYSGTQNLCIEFCSTVVTSDQTFQYSEKWFSFKQYRKAGGVYADWSITPDFSHLPYWKWFVCKFQKDLEKFYEKSFQGSGGIPDYWRKFTKEDAIASLEESYTTKKWALSRKFHRILHSV